MTENYFEAQATAVFKPYIDSRELAVSPDSAEFFKRLARAFTPIGSRIDWSLVPQSLGGVETNHDRHASAFEHFFRTCVDRFNLAGRISYAGDSATDFVLSADLEVFKANLLTLFEIPQHHFFAAEDFSWCASFTIEGDMNFGFKK
jgi:hypothetical protein